MTGSGQDRPPETAAPRIDRLDVGFAVLLGAFFVALKAAQRFFPALHIGLTLTNEAASLLVLGYILARARRAPEKLDAWGLTTPLTPGALLSGFALLGAAVGALALGGLRAAGGLEFRPHYATEMVEYLAAAFPQQFALCSVGLVSLSALPVFRGAWRLPLAVGLAFSLAHFWTPARIPGTFIPLQMVLTFPAGFFAAAYFLKHRSILPLTVIHAVTYPLLHHWIETRL